MSDDTLVLRCGDTRTITLTFRDKATGDLIDLSGCRVSWTVRDPQTMASPDDTDAAIAKVSTDGNSSGAVTFDLSDEDTRQRPGVYAWDAQLVRGDEVLSTQVGRVMFAQDVTKDVA